MGEDSICMREAIAIPVKGLTTVLDGEVCQWNKVGTVGLNYWMGKLAKSPKFILVNELQRESEVGPIDQLHL